MSLLHTRFRVVLFFLDLTLSISSYTYIVHAMTWYVSAIRFFSAHQEIGAARRCRRLLYMHCFCFVFHCVWVFAPAGERKKNCRAIIKLTLHHRLPRTTQTTPEECESELVWHTDATVAVVFVVLAVVVLVAVVKCLVHGVLRVGTPAAAARCLSASRSVFCARACMCVCMCGRSPPFLLSVRHYGLKCSSWDMLISGMSSP